MADYYPFGHPLRTNKTNEENHYRYGMQGQFSEEDEETGWNAFELRMLDTKVGRWISPDPKKQFTSPYLGMRNNPANGVDSDGGWYILMFGEGKFGIYMDPLNSDPIWRTIEGAYDVFMPFAGSIKKGIDYLSFGDQKVFDSGWKETSMVSLIIDGATLGKGGVAKYFGKKVLSIITVLDVTNKTITGLGEIQQFVTDNHREVFLNSSGLKLDNLLDQGDLGVTVANLAWVDKQIYKYHHDESLQKEYSSFEDYSKTIGDWYQGTMKRFIRKEIRAARREAKSGN